MRTRLPGKRPQIRWKVTRSRRNLARFSENLATFSQNLAGFSKKVVTFSRNLSRFFKKLARFSGDLVRFSQDRVTFPAMLGPISAYFLRKWAETEVLGFLATGRRRRTGRPAEGETAKGVPFSAFYILTSAFLPDHRWSNQENRVILLADAIISRIKHNDAMKTQPLGKSGLIVSA